jgi:hypothetical protein
MGQATPGYFSAPATPFATSMEIVSINNSAIGEPIAELVKTRLLEAYATRED